ncbi:hypothetical protein [Azospirillum sp. TSO22-1]|uniref:hypothetical protein n=1 Tax=Azospirillum sp. TSO22-1 TaxID=716789 RepID=UPI000D606FE2|nr:hypothetical protein [Azospirillum sp. TSO22-1]PWC37168.1 hypothetical protein TSO221_27945 [Azospirillum sp. TSO22-1]
MVSTPPASYLSSGVTDLNRQSLWNALTAEQQAKYTNGSSTGTSGTSGSGSSTSGTSGTSGTTTSGGKVFVSQGTSTTQLSGAAFDNRTDARSAAPGSDVVTGFSKLWTSDAALQAQLTAFTDPDTGATSAVNGGAIFVKVRQGTSAAGERPYDGSAGELLVNDGRLQHGQNPYGFFSDDPALAETPFVKMDIDASGFVTKTPWSADTGKSYGEWLKNARYAYDQYETQVNQQQTAVLKDFGGTASVGLLGFDVNNNGYIDSEKELFGFDGGLNLDNMPPGATEVTPMTIIENGSKTATTTFSFLTNGHLTGDPLDASQSEESRAANKEYYRRFMILTADGKSNSVLQSSIGYNATTGQYVTAQTQFSFTDTGATLTAVAQNGFKVTA